MIVVAGWRDDSNEKRLDTVALFRPLKRNVYNV
jgi:hypothetical protein